MTLKDVKLPRVLRSIDESVLDVIAGVHRSILDALVRSFSFCVLAPASRGGTATKAR
jgi:hypothetical protein